MEKKLVILSFAVLIFIALGGAGVGLYYYNQYTQSVKRASDPKIEAKELLVKLGKLIDLPAEEPTVATVTNADQIISQPFFAKAKNGYRVILYTNGRLAILYDDKANKIINVGTINVSDTATPSGTTNNAGISTPQDGSQTPETPVVTP